MKRLFAMLSALAAAAPLAAQEPLSLHYASDGTPYMTIDQAALQSGLAEHRVEALKARLNAEGRTGFDWFDMEKIPVTPRPVSVVPQSKMLAQVSLPSRLDSAARIPQLHWQFNDAWFYVSTAFDRQNQPYFAFYADRFEDSVMAPAGGILSDNVSVDLDPQTRYVVSLHLDIFNIDHSDFVFDPADGYSGDEHKIRLDQVMDAIKSAGIPVGFSSGPLYFFYATDADASSGRLAPTRTLRFVHEDGRNSKMYTVADEQLPKNQWEQVTLGGQTALLFRTDDDTLLIQEPN